MRPFVASLRGYILRARSIPADQDKSEVRIYSAMLTSVAGCFLIAEPIFLLFTVPQSSLFRVAALAPSIWCVIISLLICLLCMVPHLYGLLFSPGSLWKRWPRALAARGALGAAITWMYLGNLAMPMDLGAIEWTYFLRAFVALMLAFSYGFSVNAQMGRENLDAPQN